MIIKHLEERVKAPIEEVEFSLISNTRLVKFGWFGVYDSELKTFIELWMGEYDEQLKTFKFFRTIRKTDKTSDFYVKGKLLGHLEDTTVRYGIGIYYSQLLGFLGLIVCFYAFNFLMVTHEYIQASWYWIPLAGLSSVVYFLFKRRDFNKTLKEFHELIHAHEQRLQSRVQYRDDDYDEFEVEND